jgi:hypothetical protein
VAAELNPAIGLLIPQHDVIWCPRHLEPYRARWPLGGPAASMQLLLAAAEMKTVQEAAGTGEPELLTAALIRFSPLCCFVDYSTLNMIYVRTVPV